MLQPPKLRFYAARAPHLAFTTQLFIVSTQDGKQAVGEVVFKEVGPNSRWEAPSVLLEDEEAQALIDALWGAGFRPTEGHGSAGQLAATERHLADMQRLVFDRRKP